MEHVDDKWGLAWQAIKYCGKRQSDNPLAVTRSLTNIPLIGAGHSVTYTASPFSSYSLTLTLLQVM